jgi:hypothetical protein
MMNIAFPPTAFVLGSIEAVRPVYLIVMGVFLMLIAWRLSKISGVWTARALVSGAFLLGFGYVFLLPMYEAGVIERLSPRGHYHGSEAAAVGWHIVKLVVMNVGWLVFGIGVAMHARILSSAAASTQAAESRPAVHATTRTASSHESIA